MREWGRSAAGIVVGLLTLAGCSSSESNQAAGATVTCGDGTTLVGSTCVLQADGGAVCGTGTVLQGGQCVAVGTDAGAPDGDVTCGPGTYLDGGSCVVASKDAGSGITCGPGTYVDAGQCVPLPPGTTASITLTPSAQPQSLPVPGTAVIVHVPPGSVSSPVDLTITTSVLPPSEVVPASDPISAGASLVEAGLKLTSATSTLDAPIWIEQPVAFPPLFATLPAGAVTVVPVPTYSRPDASQAWSRDDLASTSSSAPDGTGFLVLDTTTTPPVAAVVMAVDHFSDHTAAIPSFNADPSLGWGAMFASYTTGGTTILVPAALFTNSALQYGTLANAGARQALYELLLEEIIEQTAAKRDSMLGAVDDAVDGVVGSLIAGANDTLTGGRFTPLASSLADWQVSLTDLTSAEKDIVSTFVQDLSGLEQIPVFDDIDQFRDFTKCFGDGMLQLGLYATLDQVQVQHRWQAVKPKLITSPLFTSDPAYAAAVLAADTQIKAYVSTRFGQRLVASANQWAMGMLAGCTDFATDAFASAVSDSVVGGTIGALGASSSLATAGAGAVATFLIEDYVTKDVVEATASAQRMSLLGTVLVIGGVAVDIPHEPGIQSTRTLDADSVVVPPKLDAWSASSDVWYRLQTGIYAASALTKTTADTLRLQDVSLLGKGFQAWKDVFALGVWGKATRAQAADSFDTKTSAYDQALASINDAFAACSTLGCSATCLDSDHDGYGFGTGCLGSDCDDGDSMIHAGCPVDAGAEAGSDAGAPDSSSDGSAEGGADASGDATPADGSTDAGGCTPGVTYVSPLTATLGKSTTFVVSGSCLPTDLAFYVPGCAGVQLVSWSNNVAQFSCTPGATGVQPGTVKDHAQGTPLFAFNVNVTTQRYAAKITAGNTFACALLTDQTVWCWGESSIGECGSTNNQQPVPAQIGSASDWIDVSAGKDWAAARKVTGELWGWGGNFYNMLLTGGDSQPHPTPTRIGTDSDWIKVVAGKDTTFACGIRVDHSMWCWGQQKAVAQQVGPDTDWTDVATIHWPTCCGDSYYLCGVKQNGTLWCWGTGWTFDGSYVPVRADLSTNWLSVTGGQYDACARDTLGNASCANIDGAGMHWAPLGGSTPWNQVDVGTSTAYGLIAAGVRSDGSLASGFGANVQQLGTDLDWAEVAVGMNFSCARKTDGTVWCWGSNSRGQLGNGTTQDQTAPTPVYVTW